MRKRVPVSSPAVLGCDLELIEPRSPAFVADYFTAEEQAVLARAATVDRPMLATLFWSGKESVLKALGTGLREDTRSVTVFSAGATPGSPWRPLLARHSGAEFHGWWYSDGRLLRTIVAAHWRIEWGHRDETRTGPSCGGMPVRATTAQRAVCRLPDIYGEYRRPAF